MADAPVPEGTMTGFEPWNAQVTRDDVYFGDRRESVRAIRHVPDNKRYEDLNCGLMYFHGGGGVAGSPEAEANTVDRFAVETGCTIFNVKYRLAPENPAPAGMEDGYTAFVNLSENAYSFGVDVDKLAYYGASGGGWIASGVGMLLAEQGMSYLAKF